MKKITSRSAKNKGARFQKEVAAKISELVNMPYGKDECIQSRIMGGTSVDIVLVGPAKRVFPWSCECKNDKSFNLKSWIRQASKNMLSDTHWLVLFKKNNFKPVVCMDIEVYEYLFGEADLKTLEYSSKNWFLEEYILKARENYERWCLKLPYDETFVAVINMDLFFELLTIRESEIKGKSPLR